MSNDPYYSQNGRGGTDDAGVGGGTGGGDFGGGGAGGGGAMTLHGTPRDDGGSERPTQQVPPAPAAAADGHPMFTYGDYEFHAVIGSGSFSTVYRAVATRTREVVAVKAVARKKLNAKLQQSLESEISILRGRRHRNIVALVEIVKSPDYIYLVLEFCNGGDLHGLIRALGRISEDNTRDLMTQLACGIHCLWCVSCVRASLRRDHRCAGSPLMLLALCTRRQPAPSCDLLPCQQPGLAFVNNGNKSKSIIVAWSHACLAGTSN
jgi:hypothetical protein